MESKDYAVIILTTIMAISPIRGKLFVIDKPSDVPSQITASQGFCAS